MSVNPRSACFLASGALMVCVIFGAVYGFAQEPAQQPAPSANDAKPAAPAPAVSDAGPVIGEQSGLVDNLEPAQNVTLDFKEADIRNVLKIISYKSGINIVTTPEVAGNVTIRLVDVPWDKALDVILKTYGFGYERIGNIITVAPFDKLTSLKKQEVELAQVQPTVTEVFNLKFIDAQDAKKAIEPQLSGRGKITVLEMTGQPGWEFSKSQKGETEDETLKIKRLKEEKAARSRVLIVSDIPPALERIRLVIEELDRIPKQVVIETRIMEVNRDKLKDIGFDWGIGKDGGTARAMSTTPTSKNQAGNPTTDLGGRNLGSLVTPSVFNPMTSGILGVEPYNVGLEILFQKLTGNQFEVVLHALEEDVSTNTLSAPRIMALSNQEATILVGTKYPILMQETTGAGGSSPVTTVTLDYYQDIGIQLNVVPQVGANNYINMVVHPAVSSYTTTLGDNKYPIIDIREAETRVFMKDGETVVIGGLLKDIKNKGTIGIPFLSQIPVVGGLFRRDTYDTQKIDLLVFISAHVVKDNEFPAEEIAKLEKRLERGPAVVENKNNKKKGKDKKQ